jgi:hypothetical protein
MHEEIRDDPAELALQDLDALHLGRQAGLEFGRQKGNPTLLVLGGAHVQRPGLKVELPTLELEHFAESPAEGVHDRARGLERRGTRC